MRLYASIARSYSDLFHLLFYSLTTPTVVLLAGVTLRRKVTDRIRGALRAASRRQTRNNAGGRALETNRSEQSQAK